MKPFFFEIRGMHCASCVSRIEHAIQESVPGIREVSVNLATAKALVKGEILPNQVEKAVKQAGYEAVFLPDTAMSLSLKTTEHAETERKQFLAALLPTLPVFFLGMFHLHFPGSEWLQLALSTWVILGGGRTFFSRAWQQAQHGQASMDTLVALGAGTAYLSGAVTVLGQYPNTPLYFESAVVILTLILYGRFLEAKAMGEAGSAIQKLMALQPQQARVKRETGFLQLPIDQINIGESVMVLPGETIPLDGTVTEGISTVDESMVTGESEPVKKQPGDAIIGATLNQYGNLIFQIERTGAETFLAQMVRLVETAQATKPPIQRSVDTIAGVFVPIVLGIAILTLAGWLWTGAPLTQALQNMIAVLIIACPCAMGLATPTAIRVGTGQAAILGILIRNVASLEKAQQLQILVLDKTGTLTAGHPEVVEVINCSGLPDPQFLQIAASLESLSEHPLAHTIVRYAQQQESLPTLPVQDFQTTVGFGVSGIIEGTPVLIGQKAFLAAQAIDLSPVSSPALRLEQEAHSLLHVALSGQWAGLFAISDPLKPTANAGITTLRQLGIQPVMATGDRAPVAARIAEQAGLDPAQGEVYADLSPQAKVETIKALQASGKIVGMVGDGINDAPALAQADVGFALGTGTDIAMAAADITLVHGDITKAATAIALSRSMLRIIHQNLFWAFFYNIVALPLAAFGLLNPMISAVAMAFSSVSVVGNSLRLKRFQ